MQGMQRWQDAMAEGEQPADDPLAELSQAVLKSEDLVLIIMTFMRVCNSLCAAACRMWRRVWKSSMGRRPMLTTVVPYRVFSYPGEQVVTLGHVCDGAIIEFEYSATAAGFDPATWGTSGFVVKRDTAGDDEGETRDDCIPLPGCQNQKAVAVGPESFCIHYIDYYSEYYEDESEERGARGESTR
jgi:hypothetical protein